MSRHRERYPFVSLAPDAGQAGLAPMLPLVLRLTGREVAVSGMIDTGASVGVLPWAVGLALGADWDNLPAVRLGGNLSESEARVLVCEGIVGKFAPRQLAFAWSRSDVIPVLLGQANFLAEFDLVMSRSGCWFEIVEPSF